jgi:hypothetical protein
MACSVEDYPENRTGFERNTINGKPVAAIGIGAFGQKNVSGAGDLPEINRTHDQWRPGLWVNAPPARSQSGDRV